MSNVQLSEREAVNVFTDFAGRILGMAPASIKVPLNTGGFRWSCRTLVHVWEIEAWLNKWREQVKEEATIRTERQAARDQAFRSAIASQIRQRNLSVNQWNRDENNRLLKKMDENYDKMLKRQMNPILHGVAEAHEASTGAVEVALDSPYFKHGPERVAKGDRVDPKDAA